MLEYEKTAVKFLGIVTAVVVAYIIYMLYI